MAIKYANRKKAAESTSFTRQMKMMAIGQLFCVNDKCNLQKVWLDGLEIIFNIDKRNGPPSLLLVGAQLNDRSIKQNHFKTFEYYT